MTTYTEQTQCSADFYGFRCMGRQAPCGNTSLLQSLHENELCAELQASIISSRILKDIFIGNRTQQCVFSISNIIFHLFNIIFFPCFQSASSLLTKCKWFREDRFLVVGMSSTGALIAKEAGFVNFVLRHIFVPSTISDFVLKSRAELHCLANLSEATDSFLKNPSNQQSSFKVPYLHFCLYAAVKTALSKRWTVCFWDSRLLSLSFKKKSVRKNKRLAPECSVLHYLVLFNLPAQKTLYTDLPLNSTWLSNSTTFKDRNMYLKK